MRDFQHWSPWLVQDSPSVRQPGYTQTISPHLPPREQWQTVPNVCLSWSDEDNSEATSLLWVGVAMKPLWTTVVWVWLRLIMYLGILITVRVSHVTMLDYQEACSIMDDHRCVCVYCDVCFAWKVRKKGLVSTVYTCVELVQVQNQCINWLTWNM